MSKTMTRRTAIASTMATAAAIISKTGAYAGAPYAGFEAKVAAALEGLVALELTGNRFEPQYRAGTILFIKPSTAAASDHVCIRRKAAPDVIGQLVYNDGKVLFVRGLNSGDRMQAISLQTVKDWGRIVVAFHL